MIKQIIAAASVATCCLFGPAGTPEAKASGFQWTKACDTQGKSIVLDIVGAGGRRLMLHNDGTASYNNGQRYGTNNATWNLNGTTITVVGPTGESVNFFDAIRQPCSRWY